MPGERDDFDETWARIVADLTSGDDDGTAERATGRRAEEAGADAVPDGHDVAHPDPSTDPTSEGLAALFEPLRRDEALHREEPPPDAFVDNWEDEGHFTPPPPPEIPEGSPISRLAWAGTLGGPLALIVLVITGWEVPRVVWYGAGLAFLAGFATLVWRMPQSREDGWDDGARL